MIRQSLRRPVAVAMAYGAVALLGVAAWRNVPIEVLPDTQLPQLTVTASWRGASPETVEAFLTAPLESAIQQVRGVERIVSTSSEDQGMGRAEIIVEFDRNVDMDFTRLDLSERLATLETSLPPGADRVEVEQYVPQEFAEQNRPFLLYTFTGPYTLEALRRHLEEVVVPELGQVPGVALVSPFGGRERRLEIELDEEAIAALGVDAAAVRRAIMDLDLVREAGVVRDGGRERTITVVNRPQNAEDVRQAFLTVAGGTPVRVGDVARVYDNYEESRQLRAVPEAAGGRVPGVEVGGREHGPRGGRGQGAHGGARAAGPVRSEPRPGVRPERVDPDPVRGPPDAGGVQRAGHLPRACSPSCARSSRRGSSSRRSRSASSSRST
jgi:hydrophobic/amphiphilic exporter-1 (mainly G- bacteria), HAE1 family